jgi:hypothetical protein
MSNLNGNASLLRSTTKFSSSIERGESFSVGKLDGRGKVLTKQAQGEETNVSVTLHPTGGIVVNFGNMGELV